MAGKHLLELLLVGLWTSGPRHTHFDRLAALPKLCSTWWLRPLACAVGLCTDPVTATCKHHSVTGYPSGLCSRYPGSCACWRVCTIGEAAVAFRRCERGTRCCVWRMHEPAHRTKRKRRPVRSAIDVSQTRDRRRYRCRDTLEREFLAAVLTPRRHAILTGRTCTYVCTCKSASPS